MSVRSVLSGILPLFVVALAVLVTGRPAGATFPGVNGKIAFVSLRDGNQEIYVMNADGSDVQRLTFEQTADVEPAWSPDGSRIAFRSERDGNAEIYVMDADGSNQTRLTIDEAIDAQPTW